MSNPNPGASEQERIEQNVKRTVGKRALQEVRAVVDKSGRREAANERFLRAFFRYGWVIMLLVSLLLAKLSGVI